MRYLVPIVLAAAGAFSFFCAAKDYDWFMEHRKARAMSAIFGRKGARYFYIVLGVTIFLAGIVFLIAPPADLQ